MKTISCCLGGAILLLMAVLVLHQRRSVEALEKQLAEAQAELKYQAAERQALADQIVGLDRGREGDRLLIKQLWELVRSARSKRPAATNASGPGVYDIAKLKRMATDCGGNLDRVIHQVLTPDRLRATLERHANEAGFWVAAASMCTDPSEARQYLASAAARFPESSIAQAALIESKKNDSKADAATLAAIANLRKADPLSSLADHYEAYFLLKAGDTSAGLQALAAASEKDRFADHRLELLTARYQCLLENDCSDGGALALSAFTLSFDHLPMLRETSQKALEPVQAASAAGQTEQALQTIEYLLRIGRNLSASGRFIVYDRLGMELQTAALQTQRRLYESEGKAALAQEVEYQLGAVQARATQVNAMAANFGSVLERMSDQEIVSYIESTLMHGEFTTLQRMKPTP